MGFEHIETELRNHVGLIRLNRPGVRNALCLAMIRELADAVDRLEGNDEIGVIVVTGNEQAFSAGADIREMLEFRSFVDVYLQDFNAGEWLRLSNCRKTTIAAVAGYALGGGCELAMMCDFILAAETAKFGQLEVTVGVTPGGGGTQRLARFIGKSKAMEMCLTGRLMDAAEAERSGLVSRVIPAGDLVEEAIRTAEKIASLSRPVTMMIKECVNRAYEVPMSDGLLFERRALHSSFSLQDQREGMTAFLEKRLPRYSHR